MVVYLFPFPFPPIKTTITTYTRPLPTNPEWKEEERERAVLGWGLDVFSWCSSSSKSSSSSSSHPNTRHSPPQSQSVILEAVSVGWQVYLGLVSSRLEIDCWWLEDMGFLMEWDRKREYNSRITSSYLTLPILTPPTSSGNQWITRWKRAHWGNWCLWVLGLIMVCLLVLR